MISQPLLDELNSKVATFAQKMVHFDINFVKLKVVCFIVTEKKAIFDFLSCLQQKLPCNFLVSRMSTLKCVEKC